MSFNEGFPIKTATGFSKPQCALEKPMSVEQIVIVFLYTYIKVQPQISEDRTRDKVSTLRVISAELFRYKEKRDLLRPHMLFKDALRLISYLSV